MRCSVFGIGIEITRVAFRDWSQLAHSGAGGGSSLGTLEISVKTTEEIPAYSADGQFVWIRVMLPYNEATNRSSWMRFGSTSTAYYDDWAGKDLGWTLVAPEGAYPLVFREYMLQQRLDTASTPAGCTTNPDSSPLCKATLPKGYTRTIVVTDVTTPLDCETPGTYYVEINGRTGKATPYNKEVLCPEFSDLQVTFSNSQYDAPSTLHFSWQIKYFNWTDPGSEVKVTFPTGTFPQVFRISPTATFVPDAANDAEFTYKLNDPSAIWPDIRSSESSAPQTPYWRHKLVHNENTFAVPGATIGFTLTGITNPWSCEQNGAYCVRFGLFEVCKDLTNEITGCPRFTSGVVSFTPSRYKTANSVMLVGFKVADNPLWDKSKYEVRVEWPSNLFNAMAAVPGTFPAAHLPAAAGATTFMWKSYTLYRDTDPPEVKFSLDGGANGHGEVLPGEWANFTLTNVGLPDGLASCDNYASYLLTVGPWSLAIDATKEVTGCAQLTDLDLVFAKPYYGHTTSANFSFMLNQDAEFWPEPMAITAAYFMPIPSIARTIFVKGKADAIDVLTISGISNGKLVVHRGHSYDFIVTAPGHRFAIVNTFNNLYNDGVVGNDVVASGTLKWQVPWTAPNTLRWQDRAFQTVWGEITVLDPPRGLNFDAATLGIPGVRSNGVAYQGRLFQGNAQVPWYDYDPPSITTTTSAGRPAATVLHGMTNPGAFVVGQQLRAGLRHSFLIENVVLPSDYACGDLGTFTVKFGWWSVTAVPSSHVVRCPVISNLGIVFSNHVSSTRDVVATITFDVSQAPLLVGDVSVLFPPDSGFMLAPGTAFGSVGGDWVLVGTPKLVNRPGLEISISQAVSSGTEIPVAGTLNTRTITITGLQVPACISNLGTWTVVIGNFRISADPVMDVVLCPHVTNFDVEFTPNANQSALTNARLKFTLDDQIDPGMLQIVVPPSIDIGIAKFGIVFGNPTAQWAASGLGVEVGNILVASSVSGPRLGAREWIIQVDDINLPVGNCADLGVWTVRVGGLEWTQNPPGDIVKNCPKLIDLNVQFGPDAEQGRVETDLTITAKVDAWALSLTAGDAFVLTFPNSVGLGVRANAALVSHSGDWVPTGTLTKTVGAATTSVRQDLSGVNVMPIGTVVSFTLSKVDLPTFCATGGTWAFSIGLWGGSKTFTDPVVLCPRIDDLSVVYTPDAQCTDSASATITFKVNTIRLRPGIVKFELPANGGGGLELYFHSRISGGPGGWAVAQGTPTTVRGVESITQTFNGAPLEAGSTNSFILRPIALPCNNCTEIGAYRLSVGPWTSEWIDPTSDLLRCPGMVTNVNPSISSPSSTHAPLSTAAYTFSFTVHSTEWNEVHVQFPSGYVVGQSGASMLTCVSGVACPSSNVVIDPVNPAVVELRNLVTQTNNFYITLSLTNVKLPNNCDTGDFYISTHLCTTEDRSGTGIRTPRRKCIPGAGDQIGHIASPAVATGCTTCTSCVADPKFPSRFVCSHDQAVFQRTDAYANCNSAGMLYGQPPQW